MAVSFSAYAQQATLMPLVAGDTIVNGAAVSKVIPISAGYSGIAIQPVITKISGTVGGTVVIWGSLDGVNYKSLATLIASMANQTTNTDVYTLATAPYTYLKVVSTGTGTMSAKVRIYYVLRRHDR